MSAEWSLEKELCKLIGAEDVDEALYRLKITTEKGFPVDIMRSDSWERGGAETYIYKFWVKEGESSQTGYIIKACVAFSPASSLDDILTEWVSRRTLVEANGVSTPRLLAYGHGVILEELIPYGLKERLLELKELAPLLLNQVAVVLGTLLKLGFSPVGILDDLRTRGDDVVMIDFGEDLGPPHIYSDKASEVSEHLLTKVQEWGVTLSVSVAADVKSTLLLVSDKDAMNKYVM